MTIEAKELTKTDEPEKKIPKKYVWRANKKQLLAMENYLDPESETFGNAYQSFMRAGFKRSYALNIMNITPKWLSEYLDRADFKPEHIKVGVQKLAIAAPDSRSPDDTRLKAYEILAKISGMIDKQGNNTFINVQPILSGKSVNKPTKTTHKDAIEGDIVDSEDKIDQLIPSD